MPKRYFYIRFFSNAKYHFYIIFFSNAKYYFYIMFISDAKHYFYYAVLCERLLLLTVLWEILVLRSYGVSLLIFCILTENVDLFSFSTVAIWTNLKNVPFYAGLIFGKIHSDRDDFAVGDIAATWLWHNILASEISAAYT